MGVKHWAGVVGLLLLAVATKAHMLFIRLVVLAAAGLLGLYLLHVIATDYRKIQAARPKFLGLFKRSVDSSYATDIDTHYSELHRQLEKAAKVQHGQSDISNDENIGTGSNSVSLLSMAAALDPQGCARRYVCTIAARPKETHTILERTLLEVIELSEKGSTPFREAVRLGRKQQSSKGCNSSFPRCTFSVTEMLRLIQPIY